MSPSAATGRRGQDLEQGEPAERARAADENRRGEEEPCDREYVEHGLQTLAPMHRGDRRQERRRCEEHATQNRAIHPRARSRAAHPAERDDGERAESQHPKREQGTRCFSHDPRCETQSRDQGNRR
jgi:hypothetical protein